MKQHKWRTLIFSFFMCHLFFTGTALSVPVDQTISLQAGWNAVFLEVEPASPTPATVFADILKDGSQNDNLLSVWMWNPNTGTVEFIQNPSELTASQSRYLSYFPTNPIVSDLHEIHGNKAYLINMTSAATLTVTGEPLPPHITWKPNSFNLVGFHLDPTNLKTYTQYFESSAAHAGQEIFVLDNATGTWVSGSLLTMAEGESFWIYCKGSSEFYGSTSVQLSQRNSLPFGDTLEQQEITLTNNDDVEQVVSLNLRNADAVPVTAYPLFYYHFDTEADIARWEQFPVASPLSLTIPAGEKQVVKLGVKRVGLADGTVYGANLEVSDSAGSLFDVPVSVAGITYAGLWVGDVTINKANQPALDIGPTDTGSLFTFRLILHHSDVGVTNLMNQVIQMWQEGTWKADPDDLSKQIIDQPGTFVLFSDDALIPYYSGSSLRDGQPVGRRISSPVFGNLYEEETLPVSTKTNQKLMTGTFAAENSTLTTTLILPQDDPSNPFVHKYHPDHLVPNGNTPATNRFDITRVISLTFSDTDIDGNPLLGNSSLGWGSSALGGRYDETIKGLLYQENIGLPGNIHLQGNFVLHRVSNIGTLKTAAP